MTKDNTIDNALEILRKQKEVPGTPGYQMYKMFETAHPTVLGVIEHQAAQTMVAAFNVANTIRDASKTDKGKKEIQRHLSRLRDKVAMGTSGDNDDDTEE